MSDNVCRSIVNLFEKNFLVYNTIVMLLLIPTTFLVNFIGNPVFILFQIIELVCVFIDAIYIVYKIVVNRKAIFENIGKES